MENQNIYEPKEDSRLLEKYVKQYAYGTVLEIGTGSGIQAIAAAQKKEVKKVFAVDIQKEVVQYCKKTINNLKIKFLQSDLFETFKKQKNFASSKWQNFFDTIIFNPPYLPYELKLKDITIDGGKKGYEVIERFLNGVNNYLKADGIILLLFSSLTNKEKINGIISKNLFSFTELESKNIFFEKLYVYLIKKSNLLKNLEDKKIKNIKYSAKGHRGIIFTAHYNNKKIAVKIKNPNSTVDNLENELKWLSILNKYSIGPKLIFSTEKYIVCSFVEGDSILDYIKKSDKKDTIKTLKKIFSQLYLMDKLKINKEEMHHPYKHIIVKKNNPILIDFERCRKAISPKNVTQFCQFLISSKFNNLLKDKKISINKNKLILLAKLYKNNMTPENFNKILSLLK